jgi:hypothetical protein
MAEVSYTPTADDTALLLKVSADLPAATPAADGDNAIFTPVVQRGLALAALAILGKADDADKVQAAHLLAEHDSSDCMKLAKLNLYQCLAVAGPHYEDVFCLGQHALMETGQCVAKAGTPRVAKPAMPAVLAAVAAPAPQTMLIPVANTVQLAQARR